MKGCDSTKIETVGDSPTDQLNDALCCLNDIPEHKGSLSLNRHNNSPTDTSSIALTTYNIESISNFTTPTINDSTIPMNKKLRGVVSFSFPFQFQRSSVEPLFRLQKDVNYATQLPSKNGVCSYFKYCSQSTACNAIRFGSVVRPRLIGFGISTHIFTSQHQPFATEFIYF